MRVTNIGYISHLLSQKNNQLRLNSMTDFARSRRRLISMESEYSIDNMLNKDIFTRSEERRRDL